MKDYIMEHTQLRATCEHDYYKKSRKALTAEFVPQENDIPDCVAL